MNNIPTFIFDLIQTTPFELLPETQQNEVLAHITQADYEDMYQAFIFEKETMNEHTLQIKSHKEEIWNALQSAPKLSFWKSKIPWQIASAILLPLCLFFAFQNKSTRIANDIVQYKTDTVYVNQAAIVQQKIDTITQWKEKIVYQAAIKKPIAQKNKNTKKAIYKNEINGTADREIISNYEDDPQTIAVLTKPTTAYNNKQIVDELTKTIGFNTSEKE